MIRTGPRHHTDSVYRIDEVIIFLKQLRGCEDDARSTTASPMLPMEAADLRTL
jgi:hypothetical protein